MSQTANTTQQSVARLEVQMSQMGNQLSQREKGTFPSQPVINPKDPRAAPSTSAQINAIHTLRSGNEVDNNV